MPARVGDNTVPRLDHFTDVSWTGNLSPGEQARVTNDLIPATDNTEDLGSSTLRWRSIYADSITTTSFNPSDLGGVVFVGSTSGTVTPTASAPQMAQESATGGSIADDTYYCITTLSNLNGETTATPEQTLVISAGTGTAQIRVTLTGNEWLTGAFAYRAYCGTVSGGPYFLQTPKVHSYTMDADTVDRDADDFVTLTDTGAMMGITDGDEVVVSGATGCTDNPNGTFRVYSHTAVSSPAAGSITFKHAGATESGCGGAAITVTRSTAITGTSLPAYLTNAHIVRGDILLTSIAGSGTEPPSTNTATIDDVQVALNSTRVTSTLAAGQTLRTEKALQLAEGNDTAASGKLQYNLTTPLIMGTGDKVYGVANTVLSSTAFGTRFACTSTQNTNWRDVVYDSIGCVMAIQPNGFVFRNANIISDTHGFLAHMTYTGQASMNQNYIYGGVFATNGPGTMAPAPMRIKGRMYYFEMEKTELNPATTTDTFATSGHPRGAALMMSNTAGGSWQFKGPVRWTVPAKFDFIQHRKGPTDIDRAANAAGFPAMATVIVSDNLQFQATAGGGTGVQCRCENTQLTLLQFPGSADLNVSAGTDPQFIFGLDGEGTGSSHRYYFEKANLNGATNSSATIQIRNQDVGYTGGFHFVNSRVGGSASNIAFDFNSLAPRIFIESPLEQSALNCDPEETVGVFANVPTNMGIQVTCVGGSPGDAAARRRVGAVFGGGGVLFRHFGTGTPLEYLLWGDNSTNLEMWRGSPGTAANKRMTYGANATTYYGADGTTAIFEVDKANDQIEVGGGAGIKNIYSGTASLDFTALAANSCETLTLTVTGAADGNPVFLGIPDALIDVDGATERTVFNAWVSATNTVSVRRCNVTGSATAEPAAATVRAVVFKY